MRKMMKTAIAALLLSGTALTPALAQDCTSPTRCDELGYKKSAADCDGMESLVCPFDSSKYFCVAAGDPAAGDQPGMILYSDGTVSKDVVSGKTAVGVVTYVGENRRFAVALEETTATWGGHGHNVSCLTDELDASQVRSNFNGASNTQCLINDSQSHPAAEYCNTYKPVSSGTGSNGWYLPAGGELYVMSFSYGAINLGLQKLSKMQLNNNYYWSSSESDKYIGGAWYVRPSDGNMGFSFDTNSTESVRCILTF